MHRHTQQTEAGTPVTSLNLVPTFLEPDRLSDLDLLLLLVSAPLFNDVTSSLRVLFVVRVDTFTPLELGPLSLGLASTDTLLTIAGVPATLSGKLDPLFN